MDMGIINSLKCHFKKIITAKRIKCIENNRKFEITMLDALHYLNTAWERVTPETIRNCFLKANFVQEEDKRFDEEENQWNNNLIVEDLEQFEDDDLTICYSDNHSNQLIENFDTANSIDSIDSADTDIEHITSEKLLNPFII
jgi:hypothetical protein